MPYRGLVGERYLLNRLLQYLSEYLVFLNYMIDLCAEGGYLRFGFLVIFDLVGPELEFTGDLKEQGVYNYVAS